MRFRDDLLTVGLCSVAGLCWVIALFQPWASRGPLSHSSLADVIRLARNGTLDGVVPTGATWFLLALPAAGVVLIGFGPFAGTAPAVVRVACCAVATALSVLGTHWLIHGHLDRIGRGALVSFIGTGIAGGAIGRDLVVRRRHEQSAPTSPRGESR